MAFLDFLNSGIGGTQQAQGPNMTGDAGVGAPQPIGPTYGDITRAALQYGSKPGSSGPMLAGTIPSSGYGQKALNPFDPNAPKQQKAAAGQGSGDTDSLAVITKWLASLFGVGA